MALLMKSCVSRLRSCKILIINRFAHETAVSEQQVPDDNEFKKLNLMSVNRHSVRKGKRSYLTSEVMPPRSTRMPVDQHWPSVWPAAASFRPSVVPLPLYQGYKKDKPLGKNANLELLKIPNFLHLTPPAIKAHCAAIKQFCTAWPEALENTTQGFPIEIIYSDYCHAGPSLRDHKARIVTLGIKLSDLQLDARSRDKMVRLLDKKYDKDTDMVTLVADRCPTRKQNLDYVNYLLTALYHESLKKEAWEDELTEEDWLHFHWDGSLSQQRLLAILQTLNPQATKDALLNEPFVKRVGEAITDLINQGEKAVTIQTYKESLLPIFKLSPFPKNELEK